MTILLSALLAVLLMPAVSHAWGGGMHIQTGLYVLANLSQLPANVAVILASHPLDFLYGTIAADITLGKKFTHYLLNCHRWGVGRTVLDASANDSERSCAYGYMTHLAADVIAHNYYVPYKVMGSFATVTMKHAYWEMRFESFVDKEVWEQARAIARTDQARNDVLLRRVLAPTLFSFGTNKRIFNSIMLVSRLEKWQKVMHSHGERSRYKLEEEDRDEFLKLTLDAVLDYLQAPETSDFAKADPTGERALAAAEAVRKNLRLLYKSGRITKADGVRQVEMMRVKLLQALHNPGLLEDLYSRS